MIRLALILLAVPHPSDSPPICVINTEDSRVVDWSSCNLRQIPVADIPKTVTIINLSNNRLETIDPKSFDGQPNLQVVNLSGNHDLIVPNDTCFLNSESTKYLDLSYIDFVMYPVALECMPNLTDLILLGNVRNCKTTMRLLQNVGRNVNVHCKRNPQIGRYGNHDVETDASGAPELDTSSSISIDSTSEREATQGTNMWLPKDVATTAGDTNKGVNPPDKTGLPGYMWIILAVIVVIVVGVVIFLGYKYLNNSGYFRVRN